MIRSKLAREKATNILSMFKIEATPVDVEKIAKMLEFLIVPFDFPDTISAVTKIEGNRKIIGINKKHPSNRQRFSIAHELGHYLSGHENFSHEKKTVVEDGKKYLDPRYREEEEADEFAAELLMPSFMLKKDVLENISPSELARKYNVSEQAMIIQLVNLKLFPDQQ